MARASFIVQYYGPSWHYTVDSQDATLPAEAVAERLSRVLQLGLSQYSHSAKALVKEHGRPSRLVRYWLPVTLGVLSSSTILRILANRQTEVLQWIQDLAEKSLADKQLVQSNARNISGCDGFPQAVLSQGRESKEGMLSKQFCFVYVGK